MAFLMKGRINMNWNFSQVTRGDYFWNQDFIRVTKTEKRYQKEEKEAIVYEQKVTLGIARQKAWMECFLNGREMKTETVRRITYNEEMGVFLFEDYILMDDDFDFVSSLFYYVDFDGNIVSKAFSNVVEETYDMTLASGFAYRETPSSIFSIYYGLLIDSITQDIRERYEEKIRNKQKVFQKKISNNK